jgi:hypothetical protein
MRIRGNFSKPKEVREQKRLGHTAIGLAGLENSGIFKDFKEFPSSLFVIGY